MSNVIRLNVPSRRQAESARLGALLGGFASHRRFGDDVFWLKENAELLNILECTGRELSEEALEPHGGFYQRVVQRLEFFPQYYRFLLSICLDLEDLGLPGDKGSALVEWSARQGLAEAEMSDLQRAEARRLMMRRGVDPLANDTGLSDRLHAFISRPETFQLPNKKAAYELTHIVFYLSDYGRKDPGLSDQAITSLEYAGILAYLDQNADLLAEICVSLRYAGRTPSPIWEDWIQAATSAFAIETGPTAHPQDDYHEYFVCNWALAVAGRSAFVKPIAEGPMAFHNTRDSQAPLRMISDCLFRLDEKRCDDWQTMRPVLSNSLAEDGYEVLVSAEHSTDKFDAFFSGFARTGLRGVAL